MLSKTRSSLTNSGRRSSKPCCPRMSIGNCSRRPTFRPAGRRRGQPSEPSPYAIRSKCPTLMPHKHSEDRVYTVISGLSYIGLCDELDAVKLEAHPPGAVIILHGNTPHFPLGEIRRVRHTSNRHGIAWVGIPQLERRSAKQQLVGGVSTASYQIEGSR